MDNNGNKNTNTAVTSTPANAEGSRSSSRSPKPFHASGNQNTPGRSGGYRGAGGTGNKFSRKPSQGGRQNPNFVKPDVDYKILNIRRVARITKGGKRFTFSVAMVVGDKKGNVGVGIGKAGDTASAIEKAIKSGKKNMIKVRATKNMSIPNETFAKYSSSRVELRPAVGRGLVAGSSARVVLTLAGLTDISTKFHSRTKNQLNNAQATVKALALLG